MAAFGEASSPFSHGRYRRRSSLAGNLRAATCQKKGERKAQRRQAGNSKHDPDSKPNKSQADSKKAGAAAPAVSLEVRSEVEFQSELELSCPLRVRNPTE